MALVATYVLAMVKADEGLLDEADADAARVISLARVESLAAVDEAAASAALAEARDEILTCAGKITEFDRSHSGVAHGVTTPVNVCANASCNGWVL